jgi:hypothetical protein
MRDAGYECEMRPALNVPSMPLADARHIVTDATVTPPSEKHNLARFISG